MDTITREAERRQASLVSALLLALAVTMISGVVYVGFIEGHLYIGIALAVSDIVIFIAYGLSRSRHYRLAAPLGLLVLFIIPILNVSLETDHEAKNLMVLLIRNVLTILFSSVMMSFRFTLWLAVGNILTLLLFPVVIPTVTLENLILPLIFNAIVSLTVLVYTRHRNLLEKDRLQELSRINERLQLELSERQRAEKQLAFTALHDSLTHLPNRVLFMDRLNHAMEHARRHKHYRFTVLFIDLDRFKVVNDSLGHDVGDLLLVESARRLGDCVRSEDTVARLGGDEFIVLLEDMEGSTDFIPVAERILHNLSLPAVLNQHSVFISLSMGVVFCDARYKSSEEILRDADIALYHAKRQGRGRYEIFDLELRDRVMMRLELESDLRKALENHEFIVHYQPIVDTQSSRITGFEALVRWLHPVKGLLMPADFIPMAEETGLIVPMGYFVLDEACRQIKAWQGQFPADPPLSVNVNLSTRQCAEADLIERMIEILNKYQLDASGLKIELTESLVVKDSKFIAEILSKLRELGIQVQIDDFGTGYSSLSYLQNLPIDTLKIDRAFISRLGTEDNGSEIVQMIMALAHNLGMKVVAEGVETDAQFSRLKIMNCEYVQGFLFARPADHQAAEDMLAKYSSGESD